MEMSRSRSRQSNTMEAPMVEAIPNLFAVVYSHSAGCAHLRLLRERVRPWNDPQYPHPLYHIHRGPYERGVCKIYEQTSSVPRATRHIHVGVNKHSAGGV